jgi:hypothetical protein
MEATCTSETTVDIQRTVRRYIPEDTALITTAVRTSKTLKFLSLVNPSASALMNDHLNNYFAS